jgi:hypothetical protein
MWSSAASVSSGGSSGLGGPISLTEENVTVLSPLLSRPEAGGLDSALCLMDVRPAAMRKPPAATAGREGRGGIITSLPEVSRVSQLTDDP